MGVDNAHGGHDWINAGAVFTHHHQYKATCWGCDWEQVFTARPFAMLSLWSHLHVDHGGERTIRTGQWEELASVWLAPAVCWELWVQVRSADAPCGRQP